MNEVRNMEPKKIRCILAEREITLSGIARELGCSVTLIAQVINGKTTSDPKRRYIAKCIGLSVENVWPETYLFKDNPTKKGRPITNGFFAA